MLVEVGKLTFPADFVILEMEEDIKVPLILGRPFLHTANAIIRVKQKQFNLRVGTERMIFNIDSAMKHSYSNAKSSISSKETFLKNEFIEMAEDENSESKSDTEEPPFEKITINTDYKIKTSLEEPPTDLDNLEYVFLKDYKIKTSLEEPPTDLELKPLPDNLEYVFLEESSFLPVIISSQLSAQNKGKLVSVLKNTRIFSWKTTDIPGICLSFRKHKIQLLDDKKLVVQKQRRLNQNMQEVVKRI
ncbi:reverse transcriptase domain-containing protein [Tanacetum coccineum]